MNRAHKIHRDIDEEQCGFVHDAGTKKNKIVKMSCRNVERPIPMFHKL